MKIKFIQIMSILLAALLQVAPLMRSFLPNATGLAPSAWGIILKLGVGATALLGFDAVSQASSIAISPPNATVGVPYVGTVSYSGGHAGSVSSMNYSNTCLGSLTTFLDGLKIQYIGGNQATVSGTPTAAGTFAFSVAVFDSSSCGSGHNDTRATTLVVGASGGGAIAPSSPILQNTVGQVGSAVQLSGVSSGNPLPQYQWWTGLGVPIVGATNSTLTLPNLQLTNAGVYSLTASNSQTAGFTFAQLPKANCYLSVGITGGTNYTALNYTNYAPAGVALTMFSYLTNGTSTTTNHYSWTYNSVNVISTSNTVPLTSAALTPAKSGTYTVTFNSTNSGGAIISGQNYDSYWAFGYLPVFTNTLPSSTNVSAGSSITLSIPVGGSLNVYNAAGGAGGFITNNAVPCVFWYKDGGLVAAQSYVCGPTSSTTYSNSVVTASLTLNNVSSANNGSYTVVATNYWGSIASSPVALTVTGSTTTGPGITIQPPANLALLAGQSSLISVTVTGTPPLSYQWRKDNVNLANGGVYGGVSTNNLTLTSVVTTNAGNYSVAIANAGGSVTSSVTAVSIALPPSLGATGSSGGVQFNANTSTGLTYVVEMATDLAAHNWTPIRTNNTGSTGIISFQTNTTSAPIEFYRLKFP
jgi:hypothetical protein